VKEGLWAGDELEAHFNGWSPDEPYSKTTVQYVGTRAGEVYEGERWYSNRHGQGTYLNAKDRRWKGEWKDGELVRGRITEPDGSYCEGVFEHDLLQGEGKYVSVPDAITEEGLFKDGDIVQGKRIWSDGCYEGGFTTPAAEEDDTKFEISSHGFGIKTYQLYGFPWRYEGTAECVCARAREVGGGTRGLEGGGGRFEGGGGVGKGRRSKRTCRENFSYEFIESPICDWLVFSSQAIGFVAGRRASV
jgi:hypothetical protein